jgi:formate-dependent phosphoribosylglycinamide formyltransferase (GAR transformylase)
MMANPVAIVLGGTSPHIELIKNLKNRGYYVILVDYYENPPAKICADEHLQESALDKDKVLEIAQRRKASLVLSCCVDKFIPVCSSD